MLVSVLKRCPWNGVSLSTTILVFWHIILLSQALDGQKECDSLDGLIQYISSQDHTQCSRPDSCNGLICNGTFEGSAYSATAQLHQCQKPPAFMISINMPDQGLHWWTHTFTDGDEQKIPGLSVKTSAYSHLDAIVRVNLNKEVTMEKDGTKSTFIILTVTAIGRFSQWGIELEPFDMKLIDGWRLSVPACNVTYTTTSTSAITTAPSSVGTALPGKHEQADKTNQPTKQKSDSTDGASWREKQAKAAAEAPTSGTSTAKPSHDHEVAAPGDGHVVPGLVMCDFYSLRAHCPGENEACVQRHDNKGVCDCMEGAVRDSTTNICVDVSVDQVPSAGRTASNSTAADDSRSMKTVNVVLSILGGVVVLAAIVSLAYYSFTKLRQGGRSAGRNYRRLAQFGANGEDGPDTVNGQYDDEEDDDELLNPSDDRVPPRNEFLTNVNT